MTNNEYKNIEFISGRADKLAMEILQENKLKIKNLELYLLDVMELTSNTDLEEACMAFIDDVAPILRLNMED